MSVGLTAGQHLHSPYIYLSDSKAHLIEKGKSSNISNYFFFILQLQISLKMLSDEVLVSMNIFKTSQITCNFKWMKDIYLTLADLI